MKTVSVEEGREDLGQDHVVEPRGYLFRLSIKIYVERALLDQGLGNVGSISCLSQSGPET